MEPDCIQQEHDEDWHHCYSIDHGWGFKGWSRPQGTCWLTSPPFWVDVDDLTNDLDQEHLDNIGKATPPLIWTKYIDTLHKFSSEATELFTRKYKKHPLQLRKSKYYSLKTSSINESQLAGAKAALADIASQLKLKEANFHNILIPVAGDLVTVDRVCKLKQYTCTDTGTYNQHTWALPWIQLWHMKWAVLWSLYKTHWAENISKHLYGLQSDCNTLQQKNLNPTKCDFHSHHEAATVTFECLCIGALWWVTTLL